jgi:hypothetical protein
MDEDENFFDKEITIDDIDESYLQEKCDELAYECVSDSLLFIKKYVYDKGIPIAENLTYDDLFMYFFID